MPGFEIGGRGLSRFCAEAKNSSDTSTIYASSAEEARFIVVLENVLSISAAGMARLFFFW